MAKSDAEIFRVCSMRNRKKTIEALRRLADRPGTPHEGEVARRFLELFGGKEWIPRPFVASDFPVGARIFYCYWCYKNESGIVCKQPPKMIRNQWWMRIKFDNLKQPRWVPVTSDLGCHLGFNPFKGNEKDILYHMDIDWEETFRKMMEEFKSNGIDASKFEFDEDEERDSTDSLDLQK